MDGSDESKISAHANLSFAIGVTSKKCQIYLSVSQPSFLQRMKGKKSEENKNMNI